LELNSGENYIGSRNKHKIQENDEKNKAENTNRKHKEKEGNFGRFVFFIFLSKFGGFVYAL